MKKDDDRITYITWWALVLIFCLSLACAGKQPPVEEPPDPPDVPEFITPTLRWDANSEEDLAFYTAYWGNLSRNYDYSESTIDTFIVIDSLDARSNWFFALTASDTAGNRSEYSEEVFILGDTLCTLAGINYAKDMILTTPAEVQSEGGLEYDIVRLGSGGSISGTACDNYSLLAITVLHDSDGIDQFQILINGYVTHNLVSINQDDNWEALGTSASIKKGDRIEIKGFNRNGTYARIAKVELM